jgi:hypothetical protein
LAITPSVMVSLILGILTISAISVYDFFKPPKIGHKWGFSSLFCLSSPAVAKN